MDQDFRWNKIFDESRFSISPDFRQVKMFDKSSSLMNRVFSTDKKREDWDEGGHRAREVLQKMMPRMPPILNNDTGVCERVFFADFMRENSPILDEERMNTIYDDMDHPITDYWIASSHNTYLEGDQERDYL